MISLRMAAPGAVLLFTLLLSAACVPWTVRPLDQSSATQESTGGKFDARAFVDGLWDAKLLPAATTSAARLADVIPALAANAPAAARRFPSHQAGAATYFLVKGDARVLTVDTSSRAGFAAIDVEPYDGKPDARLAIGPVIRGSAARDATGLISFNQFVNQLDYADVSNALNDRVTEKVIAPVRASLTAGATIAVAGALSAASPLPEIVPFQLSVYGKER